MQGLGRCSTAVNLQLRHLGAPCQQGGVPGAGRLGPAAVKTSSKECVALARLLTKIAASRPLLLPMNCSYRPRRGSYLERVSGVCYKVNHSLETASWFTNHHRSRLLPRLFTLQVAFQRVQEEPVVRHGEPVEDLNMVSSLSGSVIRSHRTFCCARQRLYMGMRPDFTHLLLCADAAVAEEEVEEGGPAV